MSAKPEYSQLPLRRTPLEPAVSVRLIESNKGSKARQGPTLGVRFSEVSVKRESTVWHFNEAIVTSQAVICLKKKKNK